MESRRNSMNPKAKEEHEDSRTTSHYQPDMNSPKRKSSRRIVMKDNVWKTYKRKYCEIQNQKFSQMEGEDYDD
jgi:hypothetical protein